MSSGRCFPDGFFWGTSTAAHQVEGNNTNSDWFRFEQRPGAIKTGDSSLVACDHYNRFRSDFEMLRQLNNNAHRLSIEWSRIEPEPGRFDAAQLRHYREVLEALHDNGLTPMLTLHHFTSPTWFAGRGGWTSPGSAEVFLRFAVRVLAELGDLVDLWCTLNEPNIYAYMGWVDGEFPPARRMDFAGMYRVLANMRTAHELVYHHIKDAHPEAKIGLAHHKWLMIPANRRLRRDRLAARAAQFTTDRWPVGRGRFEPVVEASCDFIGLNHYSGSLCAFDPRRPLEYFIRRENPQGVPLNDFGWPIAPHLMRSVLNQLKIYGKPIYITENGIAAADDSVRRDFILDVLREVWNAIQDGTDVRGYFHWTSMDNFEWARGYSMRFGIIDCDRNTLERTPKPSASVYAEIAGANCLPE